MFLTILSARYRAPDARRTDAVSVGAGIGAAACFEQDEQPDGDADAEREQDEQPPMWPQPARETATKNATIPNKRFRNMRESFRAGRDGLP